MSILSVRHQLTAQTALQRAISSTRLPHAYIFHGPDGVGKEMLARRFAKLLLCQDPQLINQPASEYVEPCQTWIDSCDACQPCTLITSGSHPDCHLVHRQLIKYHHEAAVRNRKGVDLGIDVIRQFVIAMVGHKAALGGRKVFIIKEAERLSISAQNALLKTLEEPPPDTYLIMLTRSLDRLLPTTQSRCQLVPFDNLPSQFVAERLRELRSDLSDHEINFFAHHEPGSLGVALQMSDDGYFTCNQSLTRSLLQLKRNQATALAQEIEEYTTQLGKKIKDREADVSDTDASRRALSGLLAMMASLYRDALHLVSSSGLSICNLHSEALLRRLANRLSSSSIRQAIRTVAAAEAQINLNANTRLCLESMMIQLVRLQAD